MKKNKKNSHSDYIAQKFKFDFIKHEISGTVTEQFLDSHIVFECDPDRNHHIGRAAKREVETSTVLIIDRTDVGKLKRELLTSWGHVKTANDAVEARSEFAWTIKSYRAYVRSTEVPSGFHEIYFKYSIAWSSRLNRCVMHHLESAALSPIIEKFEPQNEYFDDSESDEYSDN